MFEKKKLTCKALNIFETVLKIHVFIIFLQEMVQGKILLQQIKSSIIWTPFWVLSLLFVLFIYIYEQVIAI